MVVCSIPSLLTQTLTYVYIHPFVVGQLMHESNLANKWRNKQMHERKGIISFLPFFLVKSYHFFLFWKILSIIKNSEFIIFFNKTKNKIESMNYKQQQKYLVVAPKKKRIP